MYVHIHLNPYYVQVCKVLGIISYSISSVKMLVEFLDGSLPGIFFKNPDQYPRLELKPYLYTPVHRTFNVFYSLTLI